MQAGLNPTAAELVLAEDKALNALQKISAYIAAGQDVSVFFSTICSVRRSIGQQAVALECLVPIPCTSVGDLAPDTAQATNAALVGVRHTRLVLGLLATVVRALVASTFACSSTETVVVVVVVADAVVWYARHRLAQCRRAVYEMLLDELSGDDEELKICILNLLPRVPADLTMVRVDDDA